MFCPKCKAIISKKRINGQLVEFCNCPDKLESNYIAQTINEPKPVRQSKPRTRKPQITSSKEKRKKVFTTIQESTFKPKREPSEYSSLPIELRISNNARLPTFWKQKKIQERLIQQTDDKYERYYRKIEDFFIDTELRLFISFLPNETLTDFSVDHWGLGFKLNNKFTIFYAGTKLNDLASFESKVLEKEADIILPYKLFTNYSRKLDFDRLSLKQLLDILKNDWSKFKQSDQNQTVDSYPITELYYNFKSIFF